MLRADAQTSPQRLLVERDGRIYTYAVTPDTAVTMVDTATGRTVAIALEQIRAGYLVRVTADAAGSAILVRVSVRELSGRIDAVTSRMIALASGQTFSFSDDVRVLVDGREVGRDQLKAGMEVTLRLHPQTNQVLEIAARPLAQPPVPMPGPVVNVRIASFMHNAQRPLGPDDTLTVTLQGTPGGVATFDIFGVATGLSMQEISPGVYRGTFSVRSGNNVTNGAVLGHLRVGRQDAPLVQAGNPVTIDTVPPVIVQRYPDAGATVSNVRPNILITFNDQGGAGVNPERTSLIINGQNVTASATVTETAVAYNPPSPLADEVRVRLVLVDRVGNSRDDRYTFRIALAQGALIRSVTVNPTTPLRAGDVLTVTMTGEPGGQAFFTIEGIAERLPMAEATNQPGVYFGSYTVRQGNLAQNARIIVELNRAGTVSRAEASARLTIAATDIVPPPSITAPSAGARVRAPLVIRGRATPGHQVVVSVDYRGTVLFFEVRGTLGQVTTTADASGNWSATFNQGAPFADAEVTITATAIDPLNRRSQPVSVNVRQG